MAESCHGAILGIQKQREEVFNSLFSFFSPNLLVKSWDELKHPITSTMAPLIVTQFQAAECWTCSSGKKYDKQECHCQLDQNMVQGLEVNTYFAFEPRPNFA